MRRYAIVLGAALALTGAAAAPASGHTISPTSADFGAVTIGGGGASLQFTLTAVGTPFSSSDIKLAGPDQATFTIAPDGYTCNQQGNAGEVPAGKSCSLSVRFFPRTPGLKTATLSIPGTTANLTGTGVSPSSKGKKCKKKARKGAAAAKKCKKGKK